MRAHVIENGPRLTDDECDYFMSACDILGLWPYPVTVEEFQALKQYMYQWAVDMESRPVERSHINQFVHEFNAIRESMDPNFAKKRATFRAVRGQRRPASAVLGRSTCKLLQQLLSGHFRFNRDADWAEEEHEIDELDSRAFHVREELGLFAPVGG